LLKRKVVSVWCLLVFHSEALHRYGHVFGDPSPGLRAAPAQGIAADHLFGGGKSRRCFRTSPASGAAGESCK
jgi:hypothetical protein